MKIGRARVQFRQADTPRKLKGSMVLPTDPKNDVASENKC